MIAPPLKATDKAEFMPLEAASAVRTFALTLMCMPTKPATPDNTAPITNPIAVAIPMPGNNAKITKIMIPTIAIVLYCLPR